MEETFEHVCCDHGDLLWVAEHSDVILSDLDVVTGLENFVWNPFGKFINAEIFMMNGCPDVLAFFG